MAFPYSQAFPGALTIGSIAPGWVNGSGANFLVASGGFGEASPSDGHTCVYTGGGTLTDGEMLLTATAYGSVSANSQQFGGLIRTNSGGTTGLLIQMTIIPGGIYPNVVLYDVGNGYTTIGCTLRIAAPASGADAQLTYIVIGNRVGFAYNGLTYFPQDWICPGGYTSGYFGVRYGIGGTVLGAPIITACEIDASPPSVPAEQLTEVTSGGETIPFIPATILLDSVSSGANNGSGPFAWWYDTVSSLWICPVFVCTNATQVYCGFYTSTNLMQSAMTYVSGSQMSPQGSDIIVETCSCVRLPNTVAYGANANKLFLVGLHYGSGGLTNGISQWVSTSTTLATAVTQFQTNGPTDNIIPLGSAGSGDSNYQYDPMLVFNPVNGNLELWYGGDDSSLTPPKSMCMAYTVNGTSWTKMGIQYHSNLVPEYIGGDMGGWSVCYANGPDGSANARWLSYDFDSISGYRMMSLAWAKQTSPGVWGSFTRLGVYNFQRIAHTYESVTVFGAGLIGIYDRGDGNGPQFYVNYTGQNSAVVGSTVKSALGLGYFSGYSLIKTQYYASMFIV